jgi:muconolactone D-isomerase
MTHLSRYSFRRPADARGQINPLEFAMLFLSKIRIDSHGLSMEDFWTTWAHGSEIAEEAQENGPVVAIYKVAGQPKVIVINEVENHDDLDRIIMTGHLAERMTVEEMLPLRDYSAFAADLRSQWATLPAGVRRVAPNGSGNGDT